MDANTMKTDFPNSFKKVLLSGLGMKKCEIVD